ncbi:hypothetical protein C8R45DRAFT_1042688 [Mycena sanguinolenta]|nr:hypothetical protein C8R45DRAFT_1042688 [Mycena sanguinolenta]
MASAEHPAREFVTPAMPRVAGPMYASGLMTPGSSHASLKSLSILSFSSRAWVNQKRVQSHSSQSVDQGSGRFGLVYQSAETFLRPYCSRRNSTNIAFSVALSISIELVKETISASYMWITTLIPAECRGAQHGLWKRGEWDRISIAATGEVTGGTETARISVIAAGAAREIQSIYLCDQRLGMVSLQQCTLYVSARQDPRFHTARAV